MLYIGIEGFIKTVFQILKYISKGQVIKYGCGSVTCGEYKIEIHITNFDVNHNFQKGDKIQVIGVAEAYSKSLKFLRAKIVFIN